jgi:membrane associated rhomboid family serine protease
MRPVVLVFLVLNAVVFGLWLWLGTSPFMLDNFTVSAAGLQAGRWWTVLTSEFSHVFFLHFFINMYVLASFGPIVEYIIGSARFLGFYLVAAIVASFGHAGVSMFVLGQPEVPALGASGAISGVILLFSLMLPQARILLFGLIPMPAIVGAFLFVGLDLAGVIWQAEGGGLPIGHGAHLGGALTGALYYFFVIRHLEARPRGPVDYGDVATWRRLIGVPHRRE